MHTELRERRRHDVRNSLPRREVCCDASRHKRQAALGRGLDLDRDGDGARNARREVVRGDEGAEGLGRVDGAERRRQDADGPDGRRHALALARRRAAQERVRKRRRGVRLRLRAHEWQRRPARRGRRCQTHYAECQRVRRRRARHCGGA